MTKTKQYCFSLLVFIFLSLSFAYPILKNPTYWGGGDWDQHFFYSESARKTLLEFRQFPLWNPWYCGGNSQLAHPESLFLTPFFIFNIFFGTVLGFKLQVLLHLIIGMVGMYLLSRWYKLGKISSYLPPILFMLSSSFANRAVVGHTLYLTLAFIPYVFYFYLRSYSRRYFAIFSAFFLVLIIFGGGTYPFLFSVLLVSFHAVVQGILKRSLKPIFLIVFIFVFAFGIGAVKFFPLIEFTNAYGFSFDDHQPTSIGTLFKGFLDFRQDPEAATYYSIFTDVLQYYKEGKLVSNKVAVKTMWQWHEYSAYIGIIAMILLVSWFFLFPKKRFTLLILFCIFLILYFGDRLFLYTVLRKLPIFGSFHGPSRFIIVLLFLISIFCGMLLSRIENFKRHFSFLKRRINVGSFIAVVIIILIVLNLYIVVHPLYERAFPVEPLKLTYHEKFSQGYTSNRYLFMYPNLLQNVGTINCYDRLRPPIAAIPYITLDEEINPSYLGEGWLLSGNRSQEISFFSPNKIVVEVDTDGADYLVLNQNYNNYWKVEGKEVKNHNGLVAVKVDVSDEFVEFEFFPRSFVVGVIVSLVFAAISVILFFRLRTKEKIQRE